MDDHQDMVGFLSCLLDGMVLCNDVERIGSSRLAGGYAELMFRAIDDSERLSFHLLEQG